MTTSWHHLIRFAIHPHFRWNRAKGDTISSNNENWYTGEPDITGFDYNIRETSPITEEAFQKCTVNPSFECFVNSSAFECNKRPDPTTSRVPSYSLPNEAATGTMCSDQVNGCKGAINDLFVSFDLVKATTFDATPACMALLGPNVNTLAIGQSDYDQCSLLFDFQLDATGAETYDYAKWIDLKCNQRSRALICSTLGKRHY